MISKRESGDVGDVWDKRVIRLIFTCFSESSVLPGAYTGHGKFKFLGEVKQLN